MGFTRFEMEGTSWMAYALAKFIANALANVPANAPASAAEINLPKAYFFVDSG